MTQVRRFTNYMLRVWIGFRSRDEPKPLYGWRNRTASVWVELHDGRSNRGYPKNRFQLSEKISVIRAERIRISRHQEDGKVSRV